MRQKQRDVFYSSIMEAEWEILKCYDPYNQISR